MDFKVRKGFHHPKPKPNQKSQKDQKVPYPRSSKHLSIEATIDSRNACLSRPLPVFHTMAGNAISALHPPLTRERDKGCTVLRCTRLQLLFMFLSQGVPQVPTACQDAADVDATSMARIDSGTNGCVFLQNRETAEADTAVAAPP